MNTQAPMKPSFNEDGQNLLVHSIFFTIQGEGPFAGERAVFVRLGGCNLKCPGCDTEYTEGSAVSPIGDIVRSVAGRLFEDIRELSSANANPSAMDKRPQQRQLVVITGGEPFRQNLGPLVMRLVACGYRVQIETNGTLAPTPDFLEVFHSVAGITVVCSPKGHVQEGIWEICKDVKYVVGHNNVASDGLPTSVLGLKVKEVSRPPEWWRGTIYVQPADAGYTHQNSRNEQAAVQSVMKHGYKLCLQLHKIINVE